MIIKNGSKPLQFDVRTIPSLAYDGVEDDMTEAAYDNVNRMMALMGDIPFGELFSTPWVKLSLSCRVPELQAAGLLNDPAAVYSAFDVLEAAGNTSWASYINGDVYREGDDEVSMALKSLNRQGIYLPRLHPVASKNKRSMMALNELVDLASDLTYFQLFTESIPDYARLDAVRNAIKCSIIHLPPNGKCCDINTRGCVQSGDPSTICYFCGGGSGTTMCGN
jgi:hypothetical protein